MKKLNRWVLTLLLLPVLLASCEHNDKQGTRKEPKCDDDLAGLSVAVYSGTAYDIQLTDRGDVTVTRFGNGTDCLKALVTGKVDVYMDDESSFTPSELKRQKVHAAYYGNEKIDVAFAFRKGDKLCEDFDSFLEEIKKNGLFDEMNKRWFGTDEPENVSMPDIPSYTQGEPIRMGTMQLLAPLNFLVGDHWCGFEAELLYRFAAHQKRPITIDAYESGSGPAALNTKKIDIWGGSLFVTEERKQVMQFSEPYYQCRTIVLVRDGAFETAEKKIEPKCDDDLTGLTVAVLSGTGSEMELTDRGDVKVARFSTGPDCLKALVTGKADAYVEDETSISPSELKRSKIHIAYKGEEAFDVAFAFRKDDTLADNFDDYMEEIKKNGLFDEMNKRWFGTDEPETVPMPDIPSYTEGEPIHVGTMQLLAPLNFPVGDHWAGLEAELLYRFAAYLKRPIEIKTYEGSAGPAALNTKKIDIWGGSLFVTEERKQVMRFSEPYYQCHTVVLVRDDAFGTAQASEDLGFIDDIKESVYRNLIFEDRWHFITEGLWETIVISFFSLILGTIMAALLCWVRMRRNRFLRALAIGYIDLMRGIPQLVILMIMFYVVLAKSGLNATAVAVVSFSMVFAAYVSEMFRTAILSIGKGQTEAGIALGFTPLQTFIYIIAPQAIRNVMPVYKGEAVSLFKSTSIVGYIAIMDLTKASDLIRSRTFDAFFPLIIIAIIYFILAWLLGWMLDWTVRDKKHKTA
jgi:polar amino acid transport system substrate-binding protein